MKSPRLLSGVQPSGALHLGNYFGAIRQHIARQDDALYFIADYHALTTIKDPAALRRNTHEAVATYLALGLDPARATLFKQSDIPEVCELTWLLMTVTGMGLLERGTSYKDKKARGLASSAGLFNYPVLMAADILIYDADVVPVGKDQVQHVEMTRDIAQAFNAAFGEVDGRPVFKTPHFELGVPQPVPGLDGEKMSKSYGNTIPIFARKKALKKQVMAIVTDSTPLEDPKIPEDCTVFQLYSLLATPEARAEMAAQYRAGGYGYGHAKLDLLKAIDEAFGEATERYFELIARPDELEDTLREGAQRARPIAREVLERARRACGLARG
ncbi:tryptophan--tRNA ligase [Myxococcota bacterium]|nr:tryptophan--tRNA ligase [Myxococcota bacterium]MBU1896667.1 tryptophan--tRNA ligase [Myxococcota bacterium]